MAIYRTIYRVTRTTFIILLLVFLSFQAFLVGEGYADDISTPFMGPGYAEGGVVLEGDERAGRDGDVFVSVTYAEVNEDMELNGVFWDYSNVVVDSLYENEGLIGYSLRRNFAGTKAWTLTVWKDRESVKKFVHSNDHTAAMSVFDDSAQMIIRGVFLYFMIKVSELPPDWNDVLARVEVELAKEDTKAGFRQ